MLFQVLGIECALGLDRKFKYQANKRGLPIRECIRGYGVNSFHELQQSLFSFPPATPKIRSIPRPKFTILEAGRHFLKAPPGSTEEHKSVSVQAERYTRSIALSDPLLQIGEVLDIVTASRMCPATAKLQLPEGAMLAP